MEENWAVTPPEGDEETDYRNFVAPNYEVAWKQKLIEIHHKVDELKLADNLKDEIKGFIDPILTNAGTTNISKGQILEFLREWKLKVTVMKIMSPEIDTPEFQNFQRNIYIELKLQLNKSVDGWQGNHAFETHIRQTLRQRQEQVNLGDKAKKFFGGRSKKKEVVSEEYL